MIENEMAIHANEYGYLSDTDKLIENMLSRCDELCKYIRDASDEKEDIKAVIGKLKFINFNLRDQIFDSYTEKIDNAKNELNDIRQNLSKKGYDYP